MKIGTHPVDDLARVRAARAAIGAQAALYVDANGAYSRKQALAAAFAEQGVVWFEEPVPASDLEGLRLLRDRGPAGMDIAAGEYGYEPGYFRRMLEAGAVDVLQADASRCLGITGFLRAAALAEAHDLDLSAHCAPSLHVAPCCAIARVRPLEYFHDHARIEQMLFAGALTPRRRRATPRPRAARARSGVQAGGCAALRHRLLSHVDRAAGAGTLLFRAINLLGGMAVGWAVLRLASWRLQSGGAGQGSLFAEVTLPVLHQRAARP
jgi:hypothetical protein